jgi:hypothetical protein
MKHIKNKLNIEEYKKSTADFYIVGDSLENPKWAEIIDRRPMKTRLSHPIPAQVMMRNFGFLRYAVTKEWLDSNKSN